MSIYLCKGNCAGNKWSHPLWWYYCCHFKTGFQSRYEKPQIVRQDIFWQRESVSMSACMCCASERALWTERWSLPLRWWSITMSGLHRDRPNRPCRRKLNQPLTKGRKKAQEESWHDTKSHIPLLFPVFSPEERDETDGIPLNTQLYGTRFLFSSLDEVTPLMCGHHLSWSVQQFWFKPDERLIWLTVPPVGSNQQGELLISEGSN